MKKGDQVKLKNDIKQGAHSRQLLALKGEHVLIWRVVDDPCYGKHIVVNRNGVMFLISEGDIA